MESVQAAGLRYFLPYGETLRVFLTQGYITQTELRSILRGRGIFLPDYSKSNAIPYLAFATVTPMEFEALLELQREREDSPKTSLENVAWLSTRTVEESFPDLKEATNLIGKDQGVNLMGELRAHQVEGNPDHLVVPFQMERKNLSKSWDTDETPHTGQVEVKKNSTGELDIVLTTTIPQTKEFAKKIVKFVTDKLRLSQDVPIAEKKRGLLFGAFSNEERVRFMMSLTAPSESLTFLALTDSDLAPDEKEALPPELLSVLKAVKQLSLRGDQLQNNPLLLEVSFHKYLCLSSITATYQFRLPSAEGTCIVNFGFPAYKKRKAQAEFVVELAKIGISEKFAHVDRANVRALVSRLVSEFAFQKGRIFLRNPEDVGSAELSSGRAVSLPLPRIESTARRDNAKKKAPAQRAKP